MMIPKNANGTLFSAPTTLNVVGDVIYIHQKTPNDIIALIDVMTIKQTSASQGAFERPTKSGANSFQPPIMKNGKDNKLL